MKTSYQMAFCKLLLLAGSGYWLLCCASAEPTSVTRGESPQASEQQNFYDTAQRSAAVCDKTSFYPAVKRLTDQTLLSKLAIEGISNRCVGIQGDVVDRITDTNALERVAASTNDDLIRFEASAKLPVEDLERIDPDTQDVVDFQAAARKGTIASFSGYLRLHSTGVLARPAMEDIFQILSHQFPASYYNVDWAKILLVSPLSPDPFYGMGALVQSIAQKLPFVVVAVPKHVNTRSCVTVPMQFLELAGYPVSIDRLYPSYINQGHRYAPPGPYFVGPLMIEPYGHAEYHKCIFHFFTPLPKGTQFRIGFENIAPVSVTLD